jgi:HAD superfamily hydrolase (TIGR01509 family)
VLLDSERIYAEALEGAAAAIGRSLPDAFLKSSIGNTWAGCLDLLTTAYGPQFDAERYKDEVLQRFYDLVETGLELKTGVVELLDALDALQLPRAICTSARREEVDHHTRKLGIEGRFNTVVAHGDYDRGKPFPDPYLEGARRLNLAAAHCLVIEDSYHGVRAATAAGMMTVMVPDVLEATEEMHRVCVGVVEDLHKVRISLSKAGVCAAASSAFGKGDLMRHVRL